MGHQVDKTDVVMEFKDRLSCHIEKLRQGVEDETKDKVLQRKLSLYEGKLKTLESYSMKAFNGFADRLCAKMKVKLLSPQRYSQLSAKEEAVRCELTWQQFDERLWLAGCADAKELSSWVADPQSFIEKRASTWLVFSDQIPFWVKIGFMKVLYAEFELEAANLKTLKTRKKLLGLQMSQRLEVDNEMEGLTQKRGSDPSGEKCRITFEARQAVTGYFNGDREKGGEDVKGIILPSILVVKGQYARLDNISDDGCYKEDEIFWIGDEKVERKAGSSARGLMKSYVELRKKEPELFKDLVIFQQPAAYMDEITTTWAIQDLASRCPQAVHQRDLFASALGDTCKKAMQLTQVIPTWIASKMTPVLQLTDTDVAFPLKAAAERAKAELSREMRREAELRKTRASFVCGVREIVKIAAEAHAAIVQMNAKVNLVLAGLRRNAMLVWRPDALTGKLYECSHEDWCKDLKIGNHRMKSSWLDGRTSWLDESGKPTRADWSRSEHARTEADLAEADYVDHELGKLLNGEVVLGGKKLEVADILIDCDDQSLFTDADAVLSLKPKLRRLLETKLSMKDNSSAKLRTVQRAAARKNEQLRVENALSQLNASWREFLNGALVKATRSEVLQSLQPGVSSKGGGPKKSCKKGVWKKVRGIKVKESHRSS